MRDRRLTQSARVEDTPERRVGFPILLPLHPLTVAEANQFLIFQKQAVSAMGWRPSLSKKDVQWWSALMIDGSVLEGGRVILQGWPPGGVASGKMNLTLLYRELRVYGLDIDDTGHHSNNIGMRRPCWRKMIETPAHAHT